MMLFPTATYITSLGNITKNGRVCTERWYQVPFCRKIVFVEHHTQILKREIKDTIWNTIFFLGYFGQ